MEGVSGGFESAVPVPCEAGVVKWISNTAAREDRLAGVWGFNGRRPRHLCFQAEAIPEENKDPQLISH